MLPGFDLAGYLPAGIYDAGWDEFYNRFCFSPRRQFLLAGLRLALDDLAKAGCGCVYVDGSFVTSKPFPLDYDACFDVTGVDPALLDPVFRDMTDGRRAQKQKYGGEFVPAGALHAATGFGFLEFFQMDRNGRRKGIVRLAPREAEV
ncbi:MAG TPA: hypothetical protein VGM51_07890 [Armatimonadota bacterium]|jgi:hypothetical protein